MNGSGVIMMGTVVIVGGGSAGAPAARWLRKKIEPRHRVILVERRGVLLNRAALPLYAVGRRESGHFTRSRSLLERHGVELIAGPVTGIDPGRKVVRLGGEEGGYDLLLVAAGAELDRDRPPGMAQAGLDLQNLAAVKELRTRLPRLRDAEIAIVVASTAVRCPGGPYEYALLLEDWFSRQERRREIGITVYTPERAPLAVFGSRTSAAAADLLLERNIRLHPAVRIERIDPDGKMILTDRGGFPFDLLLYYAAAAPPAFIGESGLAGESGWMEVDRRTMALPGDDSIFAVGDVTAVRTPSGGLLPRLGAVAHLQSLVAAANMARLLKGERGNSAYSGFAG